MIGTDAVAVDTSYAIALLRGTVQSTIQLKRLAVPFAVAGELLFGATDEKTSQKQSKSIRELLSRANILSADMETARFYSEIRYRLKKSGTPIPENDIWIAATCVQHKLVLLTRDGHFARVEGLQTSRG